MAIETKRLRGKAIGAAVIITLSAALGYAGAKIAAYTISSAPGELAQVFMDPIVAFNGDPFALDLADWRISGVAIACAAIPWIMLMMFGVSRQKLPNEDTGKEHGDDRLASIKEMRSARDTRHLYNNILYSENTGIVLEPYNKKTRAAVDGRNLNTCTFGISGLGKTFNLVKPNIMQACGNSLEMRPYGIRNIPSHMRIAPAGRAMAFVREVARGLALARRRSDDETTGDGHADAEYAANEDTPDLDEASINELAMQASGEGMRDGGNAGAKEAAEQGMKEPSDQDTKEGGKIGVKGAADRKPWALRNAVEEAYAKVYAGKAQKLVKPEEMLGGGFDVVNTDPKGDNVRDVGWMLLAAGFDVKVVNTIDFEEGLHVNPLAYIGTRLVDIKPAEEVEVKVRVTAPETGMADAQVVERGVVLKGPAVSMGDGTSQWACEARTAMATEVVNLSEVERTKMSSEEVDDMLAREDIDDEQREKLSAQRDMMWMENDMGSYVVQASGEETGETGMTYKLVPGNGCSKVAHAVETMRYKRTSGQVTVELKNESGNPIPAEVEIELDPALVVTGIPVYTAGEIVFPYDDKGEPVTHGTFKWRLPGGIKPKPKGVKADAHVSEKVVFDVHIHPAKVADGVWLTKTVDCLCANLRGTDAAANNSEDPFWEDTKRLCFMALIAFLFERYDETQHTLPEMMRLLNIALDEETQDPNVKSPLAVLMEMWEHGRIYEATAERQGEGGGSIRGGRWVSSDNPPHSRDDSMALHCFHAFMSGAPETVQSIIISCQAALVNLLSDDVKEMLRYDELHLETLGDADQKQVIFIVTKDTDSPFDFITALITFQAIDIAQEKAYKRYGGRLPRHVRFELDEVANIGKIPILIRAMAVVRSRNISISMYLQSKAQLAMVYGEKEADVVLDNCSAILFLGAQTKDTLEEMSAKVGVETVQSRILQRSAQDNSLVGSMSEQVTSNERRVMSSSQLSRMTKGWMMVFLFNERAAYDHKFQTLRHPLYAYIDPGSKRRDWRMPMPVFDERFDFARYRRGDYDERLEKLGLSSRK